MCMCVSGRLFCFVFPYIRAVMDLAWSTDTLPLDVIKYNKRKVCCIHKRTVLLFRILFGAMFPFSCSVLERQRFYIARERTSVFLRVRTGGGYRRSGPGQQQILGMRILLFTYIFWGTPKIRIRFHVLLEKKSDRKSRQIRIRSQCTSEQLKFRYYS